MDLHAIAEGHGLAGVALSRASWFRDIIQETVEVPVVGGRTVWESIEDPLDLLFVIEQPNYFGCFETAPPRGAIGTTVSQPSPEGHSDTTVRDTRHLAASLKQIPGLKVVHGQPESCWFVVSLPFSAVRTASLLDQEGFVACTPLGRSFPEFPGGLRIQVAWPQQENSRFCTIVSSVT